MQKKPVKKRFARASRSPRRAFFSNIYVGMLMKLLVVLVLLSVSRILFYLFNLSYFGSLEAQDLFRIFIAGIRFDLSVLLILNVPFILMNSIPFRFRYKPVYQAFADGYFYIINALALFTNFIDTVYFPFNLKRMTSYIFKFVKVGGDFDVLIPQFIKDFWYMLLISAAFFLVMIFLCRKFRVKQSASRLKAHGYYILHTLILVFIIFLTVIGIRGGFQLRPIGLVTAGKYTTSRFVPLVLNTPYCIARTSVHQKLVRETHYRSEAELEKVFTPVHPKQEGAFRPYNVLIVIMESLSREHIGFLNKHLDGGRYTGYTPVFDSLIQAGTYFEGFANGKTSITAIPAILSSIPSLMDDAFIQSAYAANHYTSIAGLLKQKGYTTAFFHGGSNGTMGYDVYTRMVGFDQYFGRHEYNNEQDYDGKWGIRDEEFLQFTAQRLNVLSQPFVATVFTLSAHHPYFVPGKYRHVFRTGTLPIHQSIMYSDYALGKFFQTICRMPWYRNTLIVITADHTSEGYFPYYKGTVGQYAIPILFLFPEQDRRGIYREVAQQTDIVPTLLSYMNYDKDYLAFGTDLLNRSAPHFSIHYVPGIYSLIKDGYLLEYNGKECISIYDLRSDSLLEKNLLQERSAAVRHLESFIRAYIQQYNNRLIENRLYIP